MCWPDQHDTRNRLRVIPKRCECRGGNAARIGIACVRRNQCFGPDIWRGQDFGEEIQNLSSQAIGIARVEQARNCWRASCRAL
jgi:hypothetical protein